MAATIGATSAAQVADAVESDLEDYKCCVDTNEFLGNILKEARIDESQVERMFKMLSGGSKPMYDPSTHLWKGFLSKIELEKELYGPFVQAANEIQNVAAEVLGSPHVSMSWHDRHSYIPTSISPDGPDIKPDVLAVLKHRSQDSKKKDTEAAARKAESEKQGDAKASKVSGEEGMHTWWHSVVLPVEIKKSKTTNKADLQALVTQLGTYMRQVLREQVDRRYVFGLTFCGTDLRVWLCDRAGLLGTDTSINIHKDPRSFIKVMASLAMLEAHDLGWDTNMRLYSPIQRKPVYSWSPECTKADYPASAYHTKWVIRVHLHAEPEFMMTLQVYSIARSEVMRGRATLVWLVMPCDADGKVADSGEGPYVLKRCWRPADEKPEGSFYGELASSVPNISELYGAGDSKITVNAGALDEPGATEAVDSTDFIRHVMLGSNTPRQSVDSSRQLVGDAAEPPSKEKRSRKRTHDEQLRSETQEQSLHNKTTNADPSRKAFKLGHYKARVHYDLAMKALGWSIKFFKDLPELLRVTRDAIAAHRDCYWSNVLHRDISIGNILISPRRDETEKGRRKYNAQNTEGKLIDFDHAIFGADTTLGIDDTSMPTEEIQESRKRAVRMIVADELQYDIEESAADALGRRFLYPSRAATYVRKIFRHNPDLKKALEFSPRPLTCQDLYLYDLPEHLKNRPKAVFTPPSDQEFVATGTFPFMSGELLSQKPYTGIVEEGDTGIVEAEGTVIHDAVHDMESFFWLIIYLCLTRSGPGGHRRDELKSLQEDTLHTAGQDDASREMLPSLRMIVGGVFDTSNRQDLIDNKTSLFRHRHWFEKYIIDYFHNYFEDLKDLVREWWRLLQLAYCYAPCTIIHQQFLVAIDAAITKVGGKKRLVNENGEEAGSDMEIQRRTKELAAIAQFDADGDPSRPRTPEKGRTAQGPLDMSPDQPISSGVIAVKGKKPSTRRMHDVPTNTSMPPPPSERPEKRQRIGEHSSLSSQGDKGALVGQIAQDKSRTAKTVG